jgi:hypothetical protein
LAFEAVFMLLASTPTMIQRTIDYLYLAGTAVALKMALALLKWLHRSDASN